MMSGDCSVFFTQLAVTRIFGEKELMTCPQGRASGLCCEVIIIPALVLIIANQYETMRGQFLLVHFVPQGDRRKIRQVVRPRDRFLRCREQKLTSRIQDASNLIDQDSLALDGKDEDQAPGNRSIKGPAEES